MWEWPTTLCLILAVIVNFAAKHPEWIPRAWRPRLGDGSEKVRHLLQLPLESLPASAAFDAAFDAAARSAGRPCVVATSGDHTLRDAFRQQRHFGACSEASSEASEEFTGLWPRLVHWWKSRLLWWAMPGLVEATLADLLQQQEEVAVLGLAALELQNIHAAGPVAEAAVSIRLASRPVEDLAEELQLPSSTVLALQKSGDLATLADEIYRAQALGIPQGAWLAKSLQRKNNTFLLGAKAAFLHSRFQGRPHPLLLHQSADATFALMRSLWIDGQNFADHSAELEKKVEKATDSGGLSELLMKAAVDESWVSQMQSSALGLPWLPDLPAVSAMFNGATQEELFRLASQLAEGAPLEVSQEKLLSPFSVVSLVGHGEDGKALWEAESMSVHGYFGPLVAQLSNLLTSPPFEALGAGSLGQALADLGAGAAFVCGAAVEAAQAIARGRSQYHGYISLCPTSGDARDLWKWPFSMVAGVASRLSPQMLKGSQRTRVELQSMWQETIGRSFPHAAASFASAGMLRNDTATPIIAVWPVYYGGSPGAMMQELHLIRLWSEQSHRSTKLTGVASASLVVMDVVSLKCKGQWSRAAKALGGPEVLSTSSCTQSIAAVHTASAEAPLPLLLVGRADVSVQVDDASFLASMSQAWRDLALHPPAAASPQPVAMAAFGSWWPALQLLFAEAGALVACEYGTSTESCLWATIARSTAELRPWEDFVGSDSTSLMSATMLLGWLAQEQVVFCEDWEDEETGATKCACGPPVPADGSKSDLLNGRLMPAAPTAARKLLHLLAEIILAGDAANVQKLYTAVMANEDWQVLYSCASQASSPQRYLILDRGNMELPASARQRLAETLEPIAADELFESSEDRSSNRSTATRAW
ncbi:unnamed protein product [Symbiodinium sp. CCMP2592]|nr:unnamed protein product [Symbiodinium sp. CCMP2592]